MYTSDNCYFVWFFKEHFDACERRNKKDRKRTSQTDLGSFDTKTPRTSLEAVTLARLLGRLQKVSRIPKIQPLTQTKTLNVLLQRANPRTCKGQKYFTAVYVNYSPMI